MTRLNWDIRPRLIDEGLDRGVLYSDDSTVVWNGLVSVEENETGDVDTTLYFDGVRRFIAQQSGDFSATISAYTYPDEFSQYDGYSERDLSKRFGLSYRTGSKLHLVYNALIDTSSRQRSTLNDATTSPTLSWTVVAKPIEIPGSKPTSHLVIDELEIPEVIEELEDVLYGTNHSSPRLPTIDELLDIFDAHTILKILFVSSNMYLFTIIGPDDIIYDNGDGSYGISAKTAHLLDQGKFIVSSY